MPNSRSYWKASRNRSREKYPTSLMMPNTTIAMPSARPITTADCAGRAMNSTPTTQNTADIMIYPVLAIRIGVTERFFIATPPFPFPGGPGVLFTMGSIARRRSVENGQRKPSCPVSGHEGFLDRNSGKGDDVSSDAPPASPDAAGWSGGNRRRCHSASLR